jgi:NodT family efflux transporter outer membrane factor (OMF) lipoprotein
MVALVLQACVSVGPDYRRPETPVPDHYAALDHWKPAQPDKAASDTAWWSVYGDADLDQLEARLGQANQTIKISEANHRQAQALVEQARAAYFPTVSLNAAAQRSRSNGVGGAVYVHQDSAAAGISWAPDIWGKVRRSVEAGEANLALSVDDLAAARLSMQVTLASDYFLLRVNDAMASVYEQTIAAYEATLTIARQQFEAGTVAQTDVITAQTQWLGAQAQRKGLAVQRHQLEHAMAVLTGQTADQFHIPPLAVFEPRIPVLPPGLPSDLLQRRPDVAAAERAVAAANAQIGVAGAAYFPSLVLSASAGGAASTVAQVLKTGSRVWALGPQLAQTVFDGGLRNAQVDAARATYDASVASYRQTVLTAFAQVEDNLSALGVLEEQSVFQVAARDSARDAVRLSVNQYDAGTVPYTTVVVAQATALSDEMSLLTTTGSRLTASVALIGALGGGWQAVP